MKKVDATALPKKYFIVHGSVIYLIVSKITTSEAALVRLVTWKNPTVHSSIKSYIDGYGSKIHVVYTYSTTTAAPVLSYSCK